LVQFWLRRSRLHRPWRLRSRRSRRLPPRQRRRSGRRSCATSALAAPSPGRPMGPRRELRRRGRDLRNPGQQRLRRRVRSLRPREARIGRRGEWSARPRAIPERQSHGPNGNPPRLSGRPRRRLRSLKRFPSSTDLQAELQRPLQPLHWPRPDLRRDFRQQRKPSRARSRRDTACRFFHGCWQPWRLASAAASSSGEAARGKRLCWGRNIANSQALSRRPRRLRSRARSPRLLSLTRSPSLAQ